jgi:spermidine synthase
MQRPPKPFRVIEEGGVRRLVFDRKQQTSMLLDDPFETDLPYVDYLHLPLAVKPDATSTLLVGLGGGALAKRMWRDYQQMQIDAVELEAGVIEAAYEVFDLPKDERLVVHEADGREFVESAESTYDIISIDAFDDDVVPRHLLTQEFLSACKGRMSADGAIVYNMFGAMKGLYSKPLRSLYATMAGVWRAVWVFPIGPARGKPDQVANVMLLATDASITSDELRARIADRAGGIVTVRGFETFGDDLYEGEIDMDDAPILRDPQVDSW